MNDKKQDKKEWDMGYDCWMCRYNHPHGHEMRNTQSWLDNLEKEPEERKKTLISRTRI